MAVRTDEQGALTLTDEQRTILNMVAERRVRFWLPVPFSLPSGYFIDGTDASEREREVCEELRLAGLIRVDTQTLPFNYVILTAAGADARH